MMIRQNLPHKLISLLLRYNISGIKMIRQLQHHEKYGVERTEGHFRSLFSCRCKKTLLHLLCRRSRKGNHKNIGRIYVLIFN